MGLYKPLPTTTSAYAKDSSNDEYFGEAPSGIKSSQAGWSIFKMAYTGTAWIIYFPVDTTTGKASNAPKFVWSSATTGAYTYQELGT